MKVYVYEDLNELYQRVAQVFIDQINEKPNAVLGLATGSTPIGIYEKMIENYNEGKSDYSQVKTINLDEYLGLSGDHPASYGYFMNEYLFSKVNLKKENINLLDGKTMDVVKTCEAYENLINTLGIDIQLLGIGSNGHIAFNEPGTSFDSVTHLAQLTENTLKDNSRFFEDIKDMPTQALTMGLKSIMSAKKIVLVALGKNKAHAIWGTLNNGVSKEFPATILKNHPNVEIYLDKDAASLIEEK